MIHTCTHAHIRSVEVCAATVVKHASGVTFIVAGVVKNILIVVFAAVFFETHVRHVSRLPSPTHPPVLKIKSRYACTSLDPQYILESELFFHH